MAMILYSVQRLGDETGYDARLFLMPRPCSVTTSGPGVLKAKARKW